MTITILLADDQALLRQGFRMVLSAQEDLEVVGEAGDGAEAVRMTRALRPDVVLMDVRMPGTDGIAATRQIVREVPSAKVIILTTYNVDRYAFSGLNAGASGFLLKDILPSELVTAIRSVASGDAVIAPSVTRRLLEVFAQHLPDGTDDAAPPTVDVLGALTDREREVFQQLAAGSSNAEIAASLVLAEATVKTHVGRILAKLDLRDRVQAVILAYESGITRPGT
ncbi:MAG: response regulator transcription factor [Janthinobacterium lividum]